VTNDRNRTGRGIPAGAVFVTRPVDRVQEAARTDRYWVVHPEPDGRWTLRQLDDTTGLLSEPHHTSPGPLTDGDATEWAYQTVGVDGWYTMTTYPGASIDEAYRLVRDIGRRPRRGRSLVLRVEPADFDPDLILVVIRERWTATGRDSEPLYACERAGLGDDSEMLRLFAADYGVDPAGWVTIIPGVEYQHSEPPPS